MGSGTINSYCRNKMRAIKIVSVEQLQGVNKKFGCLCLYDEIHEIVSHKTLLTSSIPLLEPSKELLHLHIIYIQSTNTGETRLWK